jgi:hypothetical protein
MQKLKAFAFLTLFIGALVTIAVAKPKITTINIHNYTTENVGIVTVNIVTGPIYIDVTGHGIFDSGDDGSIVSAVVNGVTINAGDPSTAVTLPNSDVVYVTVPPSPGETITITMMGGE